MLKSTYSIMLIKGVKARLCILWVASADNPTHVCPMCNKDSVQENEAYQMSIGDKRGLEIQFSLLRLKRQ
jgi:hypothetical protein